MPTAGFTDFLLFLFILKPPSLPVESEIILLAPVGNEQIDFFVFFVFQINSTW
jgi:hypothetical protein